MLTGRTANSTVKTAFKMDVEGSVISAAAGIVIHVLLALLFLFSTVANVLVIVIFYRRPALRTLSNRYVV